MNEQSIDSSVVNGKRYSLWPQFVAKKKEWIGGQLESIEDGHKYSTTIKNITFEPNGKDSARFDIDGKDFSVGSDVQYLFLDPDLGGDGWLGFGGYGGHQFRIKKP